MSTPSSSSQITPQPLGDKIMCPFKHADSCKGGPYAQLYWIQHMKDKHLSQSNACLTSRLANRDVFICLDRGLNSVNQWLCGTCFCMQNYKKKCQQCQANPPIPTPDGLPGDNIVGLTLPPPVRLSPAASEFFPPATPHRDAPPTHNLLSLELLERVLASNPRTVRHIPAACRLPFNMALRNVTQEVLANVDSIESWIKWMLLACCTLTVFDPNSSKEKRSGRRRFEQKEMIMQNLQIWNQEDGVFILLDRLLTTSTPPPTSDQSQMDSNVRLCKAKLAEGRLSDAVKCLSSSGVAPFDAATMVSLAAKHPTSALPTTQRQMPLGDPVAVKDDDVMRAIKSFPTGTAPGRDGLRAQHLIDCTSGVAALGSDLIASLSNLVNICLAGRCPGDLAPFLSSAPLIPLLKPDNSIRPIAVGCILRRLVSKVALKSVSHTAASYLKDYQFGVGVQGGGEAVLHAMNRLVSMEADNEILTLMTIDFTNAFNMVDRAAMFEEVRKVLPSLSPWIEYTYSQAARLYVGTDHIFSSIGVQQGDPLGPLLFSLVLHRLVKTISKECPSVCQAWYLDDGTLVGDTAYVAKALKIIQEEGEALGLRLNTRKCELYWPSPDPRREVEYGLFPAEMTRTAEGVKLLGGPVSTNSEFIKSIFQRVVNKSNDSMEMLKHVNDAQCELLMLRACCGMPKLVFALRTCPPKHIQEVIGEFDDTLRDHLQRIVTADGPGYGDLQWRLSTLPLGVGGLGIHCAGDVAKFAYVASRLQTKELQDHILRVWPNWDRPDIHLQSAKEKLTEILPAIDLNSLQPPANPQTPTRNVQKRPFKYQSTLADMYYSQEILTLEEKYKLDARQKAVVLSTRQDHAKHWLLVLPVPQFGQTMNSQQYRSVLKYRLLIPIFVKDHQCPRCLHRRNPTYHRLDVYGDEAVHCITSPGFKFRHNIVRKAIFSVLCYAGITAAEEAPIYFLKNDDGGVRPADVLITAWDRGNDACLDFTMVSALTTTNLRSFAPGKAADDAAAAKKAKHGGVCQANNYSFIPFAMDTFGYMSQDAVVLLKRVQRVVSGGEDNTAMYVFRRIAFAAMKGVAIQLTSRLH